MRPPAFSCRRCGECCRGRGGVRLNAEEAARAAAFLNMSLAEFGRFLAPGGPPWDIECGEKQKCLFSQPDGRCRIHPVKPKICRQWPWLPGPLAVESAFLDAKAACPGLRRDLGWEEFKAAYRRKQGSL